MCSNELLISQYTGDKDNNIRIVDAIHASVLDSVGIYMYEMHMILVSLAIGPSIEGDPEGSQSS